MLTFSQLNLHRNWHLILLCSKCFVSYLEFLVIKVYTVLAKVDGPSPEEGGITFKCQLKQWSLHYFQLTCVAFSESCKLFKSYSFLWDLVRVLWIRLLFAVNLYTVILS